MLIFVFLAQPAPVLYAPPEGIQLREDNNMSILPLESGFVRLTKAPAPGETVTINVTTLDTQTGDIGLNIHTTGHVRVFPYYGRYCIALLCTCHEQRAAHKYRAIGRGEKQFPFF